MGKDLKGHVLILLPILLVTACGGTFSPTLRVAVASQKKMQVKEIPIEKYLLGVLAREVPGDWPLEALEAQAIASRTYALYRKAHPRSKAYDIEATVSDQVYSHKNKPSRSIQQAVSETSGMVLTEHHELFPAFFHSCCGGQSESSDNVWPGVSADPVRQLHADPYCEACPRYQWEYRVDKAKLAYLLSPWIGTSGVVEHIKIDRRYPSARAAELVVQTKHHGKKIITGGAFRKALGYMQLPSTFFDVSDLPDEVVFTGRGFGHGVGLCQWGAKGMADEGKTYQEILQFYYPGSHLVTNGSALPETDSETIPEPIPETMPETMPESKPMDLDSLKPGTTDPE